MTRENETHLNLQIVSHYRQLIASVRAYRQPAEREKNLSDSMIVIEHL